MLARNPRTLVTVALANKTARIVGALLAYLPQNAACLFRGVHRWKVGIAQISVLDAIPAQTSYSIRSGGKTLPRGVMADIFLSYARPNADAAKLFTKALRALGYSVWFDEQLPAHRAYSEVIEQELESAGAVIVLWSEAAGRSQWVRSEANRARETGRLVQLRLDGARLPMPFDQIQCPDLSGWKGDFKAAPWQGVITSVGELLNCTPAEGATVQDKFSSKLSRRRLVVGSAAVAVISAGSLAVWRSLEPNPPLPEAQLLFEKGTDALQSNDAFAPNNSAAAVQAIAMLSNAVRIDPNFAAAWGALAMAYALRKDAVSQPERAGFDSRSRSAAKRALELDRREARALGALRMLDPVYRNWIGAERLELAALKLQPTMPLLLFQMADILGSVGRWREAAEFSRKFDRKKFLIAGADRQVIIDLWSAGDLPGADQAVRIATDSWPQHPQIWRTRIAYLMYSGRPAEALQLLRDPSERPLGTSMAIVQAGEATATVLNGRGTVADSRARNLKVLDAEPGAVFEIVHSCAALGDLETAFALLRGYYFGEGQWARLARLAPAGGDFDRKTTPLFQPPMRNLWREKSFDDLLQRIGLNAYWRRSRTVPDFRKLT